MTSRAFANRRPTALLLASVLAFGLLAVQVTPAAAATPCSVWSLAPTTNGSTAYGTSRMDCPTSPVSDWLKSELVEWAFPGAYHLRNSGQDNRNVSYQFSVYTDYYCEGSGVDDWQVKANGRDASGGESGWIWGSSTSLNC